MRSVARIVSTFLVASFPVLECRVPLPGQCAPTGGSPQPGNQKVDGEVVRTPDVGIYRYRRELRYAVWGASGAAEHRMLTAEDCPGPTFPARATTDFRGLELLSGSAYVKVGPVTNIPRAAFHLTEGELLSLLFGEPDAFLPPMLSVLLDHFAPRGDERDAELTAALARFRNAVLEANRDEEFRANLAAGRTGEYLRPAQQNFSPQELSTPFALLREPRDGVDARAVALGTTLELLQIDPQAMQTLFQLTKYPFVVARRTIGGAEGTEVVVHIADKDADTCEVYYFYLASSTGEPLHVTALDWLYSQDVWDYVLLPYQHYARVQLRKINDKWYRDAPWEIGRIDGMRPLTAAFQAFHASVPHAYAYACEPPSLGPTSPLSFQGLRLTCH